MQNYELRMQNCPGDVCFCPQQPTLDARKAPSYLPACALVDLQGQG